jgi:acetyl-CoA acetyltransferase
VGQHGCLEGMEKLALAFRDAAGDTTKRSAILVEAKAAAVTYTESRDKASAGTATIFCRLTCVVVDQVTLAPTTPSR